MEPVTSIGILILILVGVAVELTTKAVSHALRAIWRRIRGQQPEAAPSHDRKAEAAGALLLNVSSTNKRLRDIIDHIDRGNMTSPELRAALDETRSEFLSIRSSLVVLQALELLKKAEHWYDDVRRVKNDVANEERAWDAFMNTSPYHPPEMMTLPARKRIGEYRELLARGEVIEGQVESLMSPGAPQKYTPNPVVLAGERVASRILLTVGQLQTLQHALTMDGRVPNLEPVLVDLDKLASGYSHEDLQGVQHPELSKNVIAYYRDIRTTISLCRDLSSKQQRIAQLPGGRRLINEEKLQLQAGAAQGIRAGEYLVGRIRQELPKS
jgi:hypothetical protein